MLIVTFKVDNRREKYIYIFFVPKYQGMLFSKIIICLLLNVSVNNHDKIFCQKKL